MSVCKPTLKGTGSPGYMTASDSRQNAKLQPASLKSAHVLRASH